MVFERQAVTALSNVQGNLRYHAIFHEIHPIVTENLQNLLIQTEIAVVENQQIHDPPLLNFFVANHILRQIQK